MIRFPAVPASQLYWTPPCHLRLFTDFCLLIASRQILRDLTDVRSSAKGHRICAAGIRLGTRNPLRSPYWRRHRKSRPTSRLGPTEATIGNGTTVDAAPHVGCWLFSHRIFYSRYDPYLAVSLSGLANFEPDDHPVDAGLQMPSPLLLKTAPDHSHRAPTVTNVVLVAVWPLQSNSTASSSNSYF
ncbi:uncharacterized protein LOC111079322 [Drosophila obscura]|uniref:uncharacterized protein LOC111079322 n=1 Tax=Drosophila obscura TaxID=7282 RepID=UPI001BB14294|nr:uncharacterized protein LOC111079322 [Drosophila obscura]